MAKFIINGGKPLSGSIGVSGAKNSALKGLAATLLLEGESTVTNVPQIEDIHRLVEIIKDLGVSISLDGSTYRVNADTLNKSALHPQLHQKLRASIMLSGPILHKMGEVDFPMPGGCVLGKRPIDFFLDGFEAFGVQVENRDDGYKLIAKNLHAAKIVFPRMSVMGTEAMMMFATKVPGVTTIINAAMEPEIPHLAEFLNSSGAKISGAGTPTITIEGVEKLSAGTFATLPDRIEAGTFAILGAAANSPITVTGIVPGHLDVLWALFKKAGVDFKLTNDSVEIMPGGKLKAISKDLITHEYPGFPTDIQAPMTVLMTQAEGNSLVHETIYEGRLFYIDALNSMGANILMCDPHRVLVTGPSKLTGKKIASPDIRAGIALVIAGLIADGVTEIDNIYQIDRGYENIEERLRQLGADIKRVE
jgi:UDP-N-acetylglucosamine 1-carboxyvinyltransferase